MAYSIFRKGIMSIVAALMKFYGLLPLELCAKVGRFGFGFSPARHRFQNVTGIFIQFRGKERKEGTAAHEENERFR